MSGAVLFDTDLDHKYMFEFYNQISDKSVLIDQDFNLVQSHLQRVSGAVENDSNNGSQKITQDEKELFIFLDNLHLSYCANQMLLIDSNGEKTGEKYMKRAEDLLPQISEWFEKDHILHAKFKFIIIKIRQLILQQDDDAKRTVKKLYISSKKISKNCNNSSIYCFCTKLYFGTVYLAALIRFAEIESRNKLVSEIQIMFDEHPEHKDIPFVKNQLILFYQQNMEITSAQNDVIKTNYYSEKILQLSADEVRKATALERQAVVRLNTPQEYLTTDETKCIENIQNSVHEKWQKLQESKSTASRHHRFSIFQVHAKYHSFLRAVDEKTGEKFGEELIEVFEDKCSEVVIGSMDFANLDIATTYLEVCFRLKKYEKITKFCDKFQKGKGELTLPFDFKQLLDVIQLTASLGESYATEQTKYATFWWNIGYLKRAMNILATSANYRKIFWYNASLKFQYDFHKEVGSPELFRQFRQASNFYLPSLYDRCCLVDTGSNKSSTTSITELVEVKIQQVSFIYMESSFVSDIWELETISKATRTSYERWKDILIARLGVEEDRIAEYYFKNRVLNFDHLSNGTSGYDQPAYVIILRQVVDPENLDQCLPSDQVINQLSVVLCNCEPVMLWIVTETIVNGSSSGQERL
ncbi:uncharacterized protein LOC142346156 [Convolutriloba macropyga]|uniref:uncharacterized protein LOC142346156 n=1 Tax=Convolutriloba macropyga TaxID=536237 RepID=UPI003F522454